MPRTPEAVRRLAQLDAAVDEAGGRLADVHAEQRRLAGEHDLAETAIRQAQYDAAARGGRADVTEQRAAAQKLQQELEDLAPVEQALADSVHAAERARESFIRTE